MTSTITRRAYRVKEIAEMLGVQPKTVYNWLDNGTFRPTRVNGVVFILAEEVERVLTSADETSAA